MGPGALDALTDVRDVFFSKSEVLSAGRRSTMEGRPPEWVAVVTGAYVT